MYVCVGGWGGVTFDIAAGHFQHLDKIEAEYPPLEVLGRRRGDEEPFLFRWYGGCCHPCAPNPAVIDGCRDCPGPDMNAPLVNDEAVLHAIGLHYIGTGRLHLCNYRLHPVFADTL